MWRGIVSFLCVSASVALSLLQAPPTVYRSPNETSVLDVSSAFSGELLDFEVAGTQGAAILRSFDSTILHKLSLTAGFLLGPVLDTSQGLYLVVYSRRVIELWNTSDLGSHRIWIAETSHDIEGVHAMNSRLLIYWMPAGNVWDVHCVDLLESPPKDISILSSEPCSAQPIVCTNTNRLAFLHSDSDSYAISDYIIAFPEIHQSPSHSFPHSPVLAASCYEELRILTPNGLFHELSQSLTESFLDGFIGEGVVFADTETLSLVSSKGLVSVPPSNPLLYLPPVTHAIAFNKITQEALFLGASDSQRFAVIAYALNGAWTSIVAPLSLPSVITDIKCGKANEVEHENRSIVAVSTGSEVWIYELKYSPKVSIEIPPSAESFAFDLCAFDSSGHRECAAVEVVVPSADALLKQMTPSHTLELTCHAANFPVSCSFDLSKLFLHPNAQLAVSHPYLTVSTPTTTKSSTYSLPEGEILCFRLFENSLIAVLRAADTASLYSTASGSLCNLPVVGPVASCCILDRYSYLLLENREVHRFDQQCERQYGAVRSVDRLICNAGSVFALAKHDITKLDNSVEVISVPISKPILDVFLDASVLLTLSTGMVDMYSLSDQKAYYFSKIAVSSNAVAIASVGAHIAAYDSEGIISVYFSSMQVNAILLYRVDLRDSCTFIRFATASNELSAVCREKVVSLNPLSSAFNSVGQEIEISPESLFDIATGAAVVTQSNTSCEVLSWKINSSQILTVSSTESFLTSNTIHTNLTVASTKREQKVPLSLTVENAGAFAAVNATWKPVTIPLSEEWSTPLWTLFRGNLLRYSVTSTSPIRDITLTPPCRNGYSIPIKSHFCPRFVVSPASHFLICVTLSDLKVLYLQCKATDCKVISTATISTSELQVDLIVSADLLFESRSNVLLLLSTSTYGTSSWNIFASMIVYYDLRTGTIKSVFRIGQQSNKRKNHHFVKVADGCYHLFVYRTLLSHLKITESESGQLEFEERQYPEHQLLNIISVSSVINQGKVSIFILTAEQRIYAFRLSHSLTLAETVIIRSMLSIRNPEDLALYTDKLIHITQYSMCVYLVATLALVKEVYLPVQRFDSRYPSSFSFLSETNIALYVLSSHSTTGFVYDLTAPADSSQLCSIEASAMLLTPSGICYIIDNVLHIIEPRTPLLHIKKTEYSDADREITVTAENASGRVVTLTLLIVRTAAKSNRILELVAIVLISVCAIGYYGVARRKEREMRNTEIELESQSLGHGSLFALNN